MAVRIMPTLGLRRCLLVLAARQKTLTLRCHLVLTPTYCLLFESALLALLHYFLLILFFFKVENVTQNLQLLVDKPKLALSYNF